jgi:hypothetical protein
VIFKLNHAPVLDGGPERRIWLQQQHPQPFWREGKDLGEATMRFSEKQERAYFSRK